MTQSTPNQMLPFDLDKVISEPKTQVCTRSGDFITQLTFFKDVEGDYKLYGVVNGHVENWTTEGKFCTQDKDVLLDYESEFDLFIIPKTKIRYLNLYESGPGDFYFGNKEKAIEYINPYKVYIKTIEITFTEAECDKLKDNDNQQGAYHD